MKNERAVIIIAEAGVNHNGDISIAKKLIEAAKDAGADYVKFQTFKTENIVSKNASLANYQRASTDKKYQSQFEMLKKLELSKKAHQELIRHCKKNKIKFLSTPFDIESVDLLDGFELELFKIPSGEITNYPFLKKVASKRKEIILSTGMSTMKEIKQAIELLVNSGTTRDKITVLHCTTEYPAPFAEVNLRAMCTIASKLKVKIGYSDHTKGIEVAIAAVALGARVIEKHFTLSRKMKGTDHAASLEPHELKQMIHAIRNIEQSLGDGVKKPAKSEMANIEVVRKSVHLKKKLSKGHVLTEDDLICLRPGDGISPMQINILIGKKLTIDMNEGEMLRIENLI